MTSQTMSAEATAHDRHPLTRADVLASIRRNLKARSRIRYSVTGGRGTSYGWIRVIKLGTTWMSPEECTELATLLGLTSVHPQGYSIAASHDYYREALDRTAGQPVRKLAEPYWDVLGLVRVPKDPI